MSFHDEISDQIEQLVKTPQAIALAKSYQCDPCEAIGELWLRLSNQRSRAKTPIRDVGRWVRTNGYYILKTYVRGEAHRRLRQRDELP